MEDDTDVDIDENSLVYPRIESIYSDVNVKTEPIEFEENEYESIDIDESSSDYYMSIPNKIILGSKPSTLIQSEPIPGPSTASINWEDQDNFFKCSECHILFTTQNELDTHKMASHSFLVARPLSRAIKTERCFSLSSTSSQSFLEESRPHEETRKRQKAVKSTSKSAFNKTFPMLHNALMDISSNPYGDINPVALSQKKDTVDNGDRLLCKHCDVRFPDEISLIKHTYELLPTRSVQFKQADDIDRTNIGIKMLQCIYCTCFLRYSGPMKKHLLNNHKETEYTVKHVKFTGKCAICSKIMDSCKKYNSHMYKMHRKVFLSKKPFLSDTACLKLKCQLCNQTFTTRYSAYKHKAAKHPGHSQKHTFLILHDKSIKQNTDSSHPWKPKFQIAKTLLGSKSYIPKQNLFKCNKCQIHFVSCSAAFAHSKRCSLAKGDWKCNKCRRTFTKIEKSIHTQQHQFSEKFKVHTVSDKILSKVLCRCPKCELYFDEASFTVHVSDCIPDTGVDCNTCNLKIHSDSFIKHKRYHSKYSFSSSDFILIEFVDASFQNMSIEEEKIEHFKQRLIFCVNCKCHYYRIKSKDHLQRKCVKLDKRCCTICGLCFSKKPYEKHTKFDHKLNKLKLNDFKFVRLQDSRVINPVMPDFFQCRKCNVRFGSPVIRDSHSCSKQVFVKCPECCQKYDSVAYDIHLTFHNYTGSIKEEKSSLIALKFYSCVACNYGFQNYDDVVEHCQKHYINAENLSTKLCKVCKLNFVDNHDVSHSSCGKFEILKFDYEKLLTDDWLNGFHPLPNDVIEDILSKSVYGVMRNVHLEILVQGPAARTLYKCAQCALHFEEDNVIDHTMESCSRSSRFECSSCAAAFRTRVAKNKHMNVHVIYGDDITFREIVFNKTIDKELNEALRTGKQKESLKFRKCQRCELLIKKSEYQAHISAHDDKVEVKDITNCRNNKFITYKLFKPIHATKKQYTVYKCKSCNACILRRLNVVNHKCGRPEAFEKCKKCFLLFLKANIKRHILQHTITPKFIPKNISVVEFKILTNSHNLIKKRRRYSSDDDASTGSRVTLSVSKRYDTRKVVGRPYSDHFSEDSQDNILDSASKESTATSNTYAKKYIKKSSIVKFDYDKGEESQSINIENTPTKNAEKSVSKFDTDEWRMDKKSKLYQCERCYLCFVEKQQLLSHLLACDDSSISETPLTCNLCDTAFHPSMKSFHEKLHELVNENLIENYFYLINISTNGVDTTNDKRWLYNCKLCDISYLTARTLEEHFNTNHNFQQYVKCENCGLHFTYKSRANHIEIHHKKRNLSRHDLHIEVAQKKIVDVGKIHLTAFVEPNSRKMIRSVEIKEIVGVDCQSTQRIMEKEASMVNRKSGKVDTEDFNKNSNTANSTTFVEEKEVEHYTGVSKSDYKIDHNLYKCVTCSKHYLSKYTLDRHIQNASHNGAGVQCDTCGLLFSTRTIESHKWNQHEELKLSRKDFVITNIGNQNNKGIVDKEAEFSVLNVPDINCDISDTSIDGHISESAEQNVSLLDENLEIKIDNKLKPGNFKEVVSTYKSGPIDKHLYKCVECSIFYVNRRTLLLHIVIKKHRIIDFSNCDLCGLCFGQGSLRKHKIEQHRKLNLTRKDFIITDVFGNRLLDDVDNGISSIKNASQSVMNDLSLNSRAIEGTDILEHKEDENRVTIKRKMKIIKLYQCIDCKICVKKSQRKLHVCCSAMQKKQCIKCCLTFRNTDIIKHKRLHSKCHELSRKNFVLIRFGNRMARTHRIYKCVICSTHFMSLNALEWHINEGNHQTKRDNCKNCGLFFGSNSLSRHIYIHHTTLNLTVQQFNIMYVSDKDPSKMGGKQMTANDLNNSINTTASETDGKTVKKLFKCIECDVHFLTRASYYHHIYKHRKLDATEYIDCNICDLQFLNESLGLHMKTHKDKSFCLEKILIEEYQPNSTDSHSIKIYFVKDNPNSKLVSTTTLFYNDFESDVRHIDDQLSIIDSTSDETAKPRSEVDVDANLCPLNTDPIREESTLNHSVDMPNLDVSMKLSE